MLKSLYAIFSKLHWFQQAFFYQFKFITVTDFISANEVYKLNYAKERKYK